MTDFNFIPSSADDGTLRGLLCGGFLASLISGIMMRDGRCSYRTYSLGEKNRPMPTMALLALLVSEIDMLYMGRAGLPGIRPNGPGPPGTPYFTQIARSESGRFQGFALAGDGRNA